jgi:hypothetical protein
MKETNNNQGQTSDPKTPAIQPKPEGLKASRTTGQTGSESNSDSDSSERFRAEMKCVRRNMNKTVDEIAANCGITRARVIELLTALGAEVIDPDPPKMPSPTAPKAPEPTPKDDLSAEEVCIIREGRKGLSIERIRHICKTTKPTVRRVLKEHHIKIPTDHEIQ